MKFLFPKEEEGNTLPGRVSKIHPDGHRSTFQTPGRRDKQMFLFRIGFLTSDGSQSSEHVFREDDERRPPPKCVEVT